MRGPPRLVCLAAALAACLPAEAPYWLIDHPINWGIRISVTQPGGYSSGLVVPEGQVRAAAVPLDTVELEWLALAPPGGELAPPIWISCGFDCNPYSLNPYMELPPCERPMPLLQAEPCRIGEGHRLSLTFAGAYDAPTLGGGPLFGAYAGQLSLMAIGSASPDVSPETCLQRLRARPKVALESCLMSWREYNIAAPLPSGLPDPTGPFGQPPPDFPFPPEVLAQAPDTHPVVDGFWVSRESDAGRVELDVADGGAVKVRPGDRIGVELRVTPESEQEYYNAAPGGTSWMWIPETELVYHRAALTAMVEEEDFTAEEQAWFVVPAVAEPFTMHFYIADTREGRATASLRFVPEDMFESP
jgi:hypothetical protein